jgi:hypothetical protein
MILVITSIALVGYSVYAYMQNVKHKTRILELESITSAMQAANASLVEELASVKRSAQSANDKLKAAKSKTAAPPKASAKPAKEKVEKKVATKKK